MRSCIQRGNMLIVVKEDKALSSVEDFFIKCDVHYNVTRLDSFVVVDIEDGVVSKQDLQKFDVDVLDKKEGYILASRKYHPANTYINVGDVSIGKDFCVMAGPCSIESECHIIDLALKLKKLGVNILRGGAFKPRTSPYSFQGLGIDGLKYLKRAKETSGLPIVSEILDVRYLDEYEDVDIIQVGARNMQNYALLKELSHIDTPILLKRSVGATVTEWLYSAEYILSGGNNNVILCERGVRTSQNRGIKALDVDIIKDVRELTHLPIIVDPSHAAGDSKFVTPLALSAIEAGANGLIVEVHDNPIKAYSDGMQSLSLAQFEDLMKKI